MDDAPNTHRGCMSPLCGGQVSAAQEPARCCCFQTKSCAYYLPLQLQWGVRATTLTNISSEIYETMNVQSMHGQTQQTEASMGSHVVDKDTAEHGASLHSLHASTPVRAKKHAPQSTDLAVFPLQQPTTSWWHIKDGRKLHVILKSRAVLNSYFSCLYSAMLRGRTEKSRACKCNAYSALMPMLFMCSRAKRQHFAHSLNAFPLSISTKTCACKSCQRVIWSVREYYLMRVLHVALESC